jgi:hypothetical protein
MIPPSAALSTERVNFALLHSWMVTANKNNNLHYNKYSTLKTDFPIWIVSLCPLIFGTRFPVLFMTCFIICNMFPSGPTLNPWDQLHQIGPRAVVISARVIYYLLFKYTQQHIACFTENNWAPHLLRAACLVPIWFGPCFPSQFVICFRT